MKIDLYKELAALKEKIQPTTSTECYRQLEALRQISKCYPHGNRLWEYHYSKRRSRLIKMYWIYKRSV